MAVVRVRFRPYATEDEPTTASVITIGDDDGRWIARLDLRPSNDALVEHHPVFDVEWLDDTGVVVRRSRALLFRDQVAGTLNLSDLMDSD